METTITLLMFIVAWHALRARYQRMRIALLGRHLARLQIERHMETLTQGYARALREDTEARQLHVFEMFAATENAVAGQVQSLAKAMQEEDAVLTGMGTLPFCIPYAERFLPAALTRDFRHLLQIHAAGMRHVLDGEPQWDAKDRAFHFSAELYLFQHSCHWFCKSRAVADARLMLLHQLKHEKVLESVSEPTRCAYLAWLSGSPPRLEE